MHKEFPWRKGERQKGHQDLPPGFATWICHLDWPPGLATWISPLDPGFATWWWNSLLIGPLLLHAHNMQPKLWIDSLALRFLRISSTAALIHYKFILEAFKGQKPNRRVNNYHWYSIAQSVLENFNISRPAKITQTNLPSSSPSSTHYLVRFPNPLATGHSWQLGNLTTHYLAQHREEGLLLGQHRGGGELVAIMLMLMLMSTLRKWGRQLVVNFSVGHHGHTYRLGSPVNIATLLQRVHMFEANCVKTLMFSG